MLRLIALTLLLAMMSSATANTQQPVHATPPLQDPSAYDAAVAHAKPIEGPASDGRRALAAKHFLQARRIFLAALKAHPGNIDVELGLADAELALHRYEAAELGYRQIVAQQPEMWQAHKNLVIVEAALDRWEEFDRERAILRGARERGSAGISARESDVIDSFVVNGRRWIVREYFEPVGRSATRYNFERFSATGRAEEYISLESDAAARALVPGGAVTIGSETVAPTAASGYALNWYTGQGHGTVQRYENVEPDYERVRADAMRWLRSRPTQAARPSAASKQE